MRFSFSVTGMALFRLAVKSLTSMLFSRRKRKSGSVELGTDSAASATLAAAFHLFGFAVAVSVLTIPTMAFGGLKKVLISSQPSGAKVTLLGGGMICKSGSREFGDGITPCSFSIDKGAFDPDGAPWENSTLLGVPLTISLSKEGYRSTELTLTDGPHVWKGRDTTGPINRTYYFVKSDKFAALLDPDPDYRELTHRLITERGSEKLKSVNARDALADCKRYYDQSEPQKAIYACNEVIGLMGDAADPDVFHYRCMANFLLNKLQAALEDCQDLLKFRKQSDVAWNNTGLILQSLGRDREALERFTTALSINGANVKTLHNRSLSYERLGMIEEALQDCNTALKLAPENVEIAGLRKHLLSILQPVK